MTTPIIDTSFRPGCYVFGYTVPGQGHFGQTRFYNQTAIFGTRAFGSQACGKNTEDDLFTFRYGAPVPRKTGPWPLTPWMSIRHNGPWAKRIVFYTWRNRPMVKRYTPYAGSPKESIAHIQLKLMESSFLWSILTDENKARLNADAKRTGAATQGHNYFTKLYINDDPHWQDYV